MAERSIVRKSSPGRSRMDLTESRQPRYLLNSSSRKNIREPVIQNEQTVLVATGEIDKGQGIEQGDYTFVKGIGSIKGISSNYVTSAGYSSYFIRNEAYPSSVPRNWSSSGKRKAPETDSEQVDDFQPFNENLRMDTRYENVSCSDEELEAFNKVIQLPGQPLPDFVDFFPEQFQLVAQRKVKIRKKLHKETDQQLMQIGKDVSVTNTPSLKLMPCSICRVKYASADDMTILKCWHDFHKDCIKQWVLNGAMKCPVCRIDVL